MREQPRDDATDGSEYKAVEAGDGEFVIYDRSTKTAWIQSDYTVEVRE